MEKYFDVMNRELNIGDTITVFLYSTNGLLPIDLTITNNEDLESLVKVGLAVKKKFINNNKNIDYYINIIKNKIGLSYSQTLNLLSAAESIAKGTGCEMLLRTIAIELDKNYVDHISKSEEIYFVSAFSGEIQKIRNLKSIKSFKTFSAFRTLQEAEHAKSIVQELLNDYYKK